MSISQIPGKPLPEDQVPEWIRYQLKQLFPDQNNLVWRKRFWYYEAVLDDNTMVCYNAFGGLQKIVSTLTIKDLPDSIYEYILNNYAGYKLVKALKIGKHNTIRFEVEISKDYQLHTLIFDKTGKLVDEKRTQLIS